jgi:hypothetical protein
MQENPMTTPVVIPRLYLQYRVIIADAPTPDGRWVVRSVDGKSPSTLACFAEPDVDFGNLSTVLSYYGHNEWEMVSHVVDASSATHVITLKLAKSTPKPMRPGEDSVRAPKQG